MFGTKKIAFAPRLPLSLLAGGLLISANAFAVPDTGMSAPAAPAPWQGGNDANGEVPPPSGPYQGVPYPRTRPSAQRQVRPAMPPRPHRPAGPAMSPRANHPARPAMPPRADHPARPAMPPGFQTPQRPGYPSHPGYAPGSSGHAMQERQAPAYPVPPPPTPAAEAPRADAPAGGGQADSRAYGVVPPEWRDFPEQGASEWGPGSRTQPPAPRWQAPAYPSYPSYSGSAPVPPAPGQRPYANPYYGYPSQPARPHYGYPPAQPPGAQSGAGGYGPYYGPETGAPGAGESR